MKKNIVEGRDEDFLPLQIDLGKCWEMKNSNSVCSE
jgi:hypothetical protein